MNKKNVPDTQTRENNTKSREMEVQKQSFPPGEEGLGLVLYRDYDTDPTATRIRWNSLLFHCHMGRSQRRMILPHSRLTLSGIIALWADVIGGLLVCYYAAHAGRAMIPLWTVQFSDHSVCLCLPTVDFSQGIPCLNYGLHSCASG